MATIKGGIKLEAGKPIPQKILDAVGGIRLPFIGNFRFTGKPGIDKSKLRLADGSKLK
jgi:hypothetical protein